MAHLSQMSQRKMEEQYYQQLREEQKQQSKMQKTGKVSRLNSQMLVKMDQSMLKQHTGGFMEAKRSLGSQDKSNESFENSQSPALRAIEANKNQLNTKKNTIGLHSEMSKHSSHLKSIMDGQDGQAQATEFSEQSSIMEAMLALSAQKKLRVITTKNFN